jgi:predicted TPR repeat methyltransferase
MRYSYAGECFKRAAELKPREVEYFFMLGEACEKDSDYENALYAYEKILTIEPYNEKAQTLAKEVKIKQNELEKAFTQTQ